MVDSHFPENVTSFGITVIISWFSRALVTVWVWRAATVMMKKSVLRMPTALYALRLVAAEPKVSSEKKTIRNSIMTVQCPWVTRFLFYGN